MKVGRLVVLGQLAEHGALHGHEIRRRAERTDVAEWGGVPIGSLYRELHLLAEEGLVVAVRSEQIGRRPARTIYEITEEGRIELGVLREQALREFQHAADPVGVALLFAGGPSAAEWAQLLAPRRRHIAAVLASLGEERVRHTARGYLGPLAIAAFRRGELALHAELAWYDECDQILARLDTVPAPPGLAPVAAGRNAGNAAASSATNPDDSNRNEGAPAERGETDNLASDLDPLSPRSRAEC